MADAKEKNLRQVKDEGPKELIDKALLYVASLLSPEENGDIACPWCPWKTTTPDTREVAIVGHMKAHHNDHVMAAFFHKDYGIDAYDVLRQQTLDEEIVANVNPTLRKPAIDVEELDVFDHLWITPAMKKHAAGEGGAFRFVTTRKFGQYQAMGAQVVERPRDITPPSQASTEDTTWRANEMMLMYFPPALKEKRDRIRRQAVDSQTQALYGRKEQMDQSMTAVEESVYEYYRKRRMPEANARMLARRLAQQGAAVAGRRVSPPTREDPDAVTVITRG